MAGIRGRARAAGLVCGLVIAGTGAATSYAGTVAPNLTGAWLVQGHSSYPAWNLTASANRLRLTGSWRDPAPHQGLRGTFTTTLNSARTAYDGTFHVTEGSINGNGTISFRIVSANKLAVAIHQRGHAPGSTTLVRNTCGAGTAALAMSADGKSSESFAVGSTATLGVTESGSTPACQGPTTLSIVGTQISGGSGTARYACTSVPCTQQVTESSAGAWSYQARLFSKNNTELAHSSAVTVTWVAPTPTIMISSSGAGTISPPYNPGPGSTTWTFGGSTHTTTCGGAATTPVNGGYGGGCTLNQAVNPAGSATITATLNQPLPSGQQLVIIYDSGNAADPEFQKCLQGYQTGLGCVIAATTGESTQVSIPIPTTKSAYGGVHYLVMFAQYYPATSPSAELDIALCEGTGSSACG